MESQPDWNESLMVLGYENDSLLTEQVRENLDDYIHFESWEEDREEGIGDVGKTVARWGSRDFDGSVV